MKREFIILAQEILKRRVNPNLDVDGDFGKESIAAARKFSIAFKARAFSVERWIAATIQREAFLRGAPTIATPIEHDAWWGPDTQDAAYRLIGNEHVGWRPDEISPIEVEEPFKVKCWTPSDSQMIRKYGQPGTNQVTIKLPFEMRLDWALATKVKTTSCHKLAKILLLALLKQFEMHMESKQFVNLELIGLVVF